MKPFLTECQYTKPMMPIIYDDLHQLSRDIVSRYNKPKTLEKCKNANILCDINFTENMPQIVQKESHEAM